MSSKTSDWLHPLLHRVPRLAQTISHLVRRCGRLPAAVAVLLLTALLAPFVPTEPLQAQTAWQAAYWNNRTLSGEPVLERRELNINYDWGMGSPDPRVNPDNFSARWTRTVTLPAGTYRFTATVDDGLRVWVNDQLVIDAWAESAARTVQEDLYLPAGTYSIRVDYYEAFGAAVAQLERTQLTTAPEPTAPESTVAPPTVPTTVPTTAPTEAAPRAQWRGAYFNNADLAGEPALVRNENNIDFTWGSGSPAPDLIDPETFSARWTRTFDLAPGRYRFALTVDDGGRLYVNDQLLIDQWHDQAATTYTAEFDWAGGPLPVRVEYYENRGDATARFSYADVLSEPTPTPTPTVSVPASGSWRGEYFDNVTLAGPPAFVRSDPQIDFDWGRGSPAPDILGTDRFSVRWTQTVDVPAGCYQFIVTADDGVRLYVAGKLVIDAFTVQSAQSFNYDARLPAGPSEIVMEYFENTGEAVAKLSWSRDPCFPVIPTSTPGGAAGQSTASVTGASFLNVRAGPSTNFRPIDTLARGETVVLVGRNVAASWIEIQLSDGRTGWVNGRYLNSDVAFTTLPVTS